jgi:hypothetical protein
VALGKRVRIPPTRLGALMAERVRFLSDSGVEYEAEIAPPLWQALRAGYPMKGWPYPWREVSQTQAVGSSPQEGAET